MKRIIGPLVVPLAIALGCVSLLVFLQWLHPSLFIPLDIAASDHLFVREDGPHLGGRAVREDIVLVLVDAVTTRARNGDLPGRQEDLRLYRTLLDAGARVVADTHMLAGADEESINAIRPLLQGMAETRDDGSLMRDIWIPVTTAPEDRDRWASCIAPIVINMHPNAFTDFETRLFPLTTFMCSGPVETMPLRILRAYRGLPIGSSAAVDAELERCHIFVSWGARQDASEYRAKSPPFYRLGRLPVRWYGFPSTSTLVPPAAFWMSYDAPPSQFRRFSYSDVLAGHGLEEFADKIVIVGRDAGIDPTGETFTIPTSLQKASIAELVGAAVQTLLDERFSQELPLLAQLLVAFSLTAALTLTTSLLRPVVAVLGTCMLLAVYFGTATIAYRLGWLPSVLLVPATAILAGGLGGTYQLILALRARSRVVDLFGRYVPRAVVQQLMQKPELEALVVGGVRRNVSVMFADIRGFTHFSENLDPETVLGELNSLLDGMVACTFAAEGTLDKFIGDAILVLFNAPLEQPDHIHRAVSTALMIQARVAHHSSGLSIGIGIHSGDAVVGNIGTPERMEYTAIGSTVNIASRLCDIARPGEIIVSAAVASQLTGQFMFEARPATRVKGIERELDNFLAIRPAESNSEAAAPAGEYRDKSSS